MVELIKCGKMFYENCYVLSNKGLAVVIDPGMDFSKETYEAIVSKYEVVGVLITHGHVDHIDGIGYFKCPIYINELEYDFLKDDDLSLYSDFDKKKNYKLNDLNIIKVKDNDEINLLDEPIKVINTPGHTVGGTSYLYKNRLFSGDTLFKCSVGRTDFPTGNERNLFKSIIKLIDNTNDNTIVYPGHDDTTTIRDERKYNPYYKEAINRYKN